MKKFITILAMVLSFHVYSETGGEKSNDRALDILAGIGYYKYLSEYCGYYDYARRITKFENKLKSSKFFRIWKLIDDPYLAIKNNKHKPEVKQFLNCDNLVGINPKIDEALSILTRDLGL